MIESHTRAVLKRDAVRVGLDPEFHAETGSGHLKIVELGLDAFAQFLCGGLAPGRQSVALFG